jgi:hypothetical protein
MWWEFSLLLTPPSLCFWGSFVSMWPQWTFKGHSPLQPSFLFVCVVLGMNLVHVGQVLTTELSPALSCFDNGFIEIHSRIIKLT